MAWITHPTPKPIPMVADAIRDVSNRGHIVLDSFMGSGTTLLAAERTGRIAYPRLRDRVKAQQQLWKADKVLIEDAGAGQHLWQDMRQKGLFRPVLLRPAADKVTRMVGQLALIEDGDLPPESSLDLM